MFKMNCRFDIGAILLASVLTAVGISDAQAGGAGSLCPGGGPCADGVPARHGAALTGGKGGVTGGDVRSRGGRAVSARHERPGRPGGIHTTGGISGGVVGSRK